jgi:hypothetical protein
MIHTGIILPSGQGRPGARRAGRAFGGFANAVEAAWAKAGTVGGMIEPRHEHFDHTADLGVRVWAPTLAGLVLPAPAGLDDVIGRLETVGAPAPSRFKLSSDVPPGHELDSPLQLPMDAD